jgi:hypothetical protein
MNTKRYIAFLRDQCGNVLVEVTVMIPFLLTLLLGSVDFLNVYLQLNEATKAVEVGARIAAVSDPVASGLSSPTGQTNIATGWATASCPLGSTSDTCMPAFTITCDGGTQACTCTSGSCTGMGSYSSTAMNYIVYGRDGKNACGDAPSYYAAGICDIFNAVPPIGPANVKVIYRQTGLGFVGRGAGAVPTITVELQNVPFQFFFLNGLLGFANKKVNNNIATTITGEALSSAAAN